MLSTPDPGDTNGQPLEASQAVVAKLPWSLRDAWVGIGLSLPALALSALALQRVPDTQLRGLASLSVYELALVMPALSILLIRRATWRDLGFRSFQAQALVLGFAVVLATYVATIIHNTLLILFGLPTQGESILQFLRMTNAPWGLALGGVVVGPIVEEIVFRGFLFQSLRQAYGATKALFLSSAVFAVMHMQPEALIPTFLLGCALAFVFHRARSIWPGILLHLLVNLVGVATLLALS